MEAENGGRGSGVSFFSNGSNGSSASMRTRRKTHEESCFCGLKAALRKSGTAENPNRLFRACPRRAVTAITLSGLTMMSMKWWAKVEQRKITGLGEGGTKKDYGAELQVESDYDEWRLKVAWRLGSLEAEFQVKQNVLICHAIMRVIC
ncbi:uncharacterized protein DS421_6g188620 [Arachis hypogaea]|nr:uncharacterized protein DS421_6g188620 [Arachis hypogaea]